MNEKIKAYYVADDIDEVLNYIDNLQQEKDNLQNRIDKALKHIDRIFDEGDEDKVIDNLLRLEKILKGE